MATPSVLRLTGFTNLSAKFLFLVNTYASAQQSDIFNKHLTYHGLLIVLHWLLISLFSRTKLLKKQRSLIFH